MKAFEQLGDAGKARRQRAVAAQVLGEWGIVPASIRRLAVDTNFMYRVVSTSGEVFALRIHRDGLRAPVDIELECWWLDELRRNGAPVVEVVPAIDGRFLVQAAPAAGVPDGRSAVLFRWLPGRLGDDSERAYWVTLGETMARLHLAAAATAVPTWARPKRWDSVFYFEPPVLWNPEHLTATTAEQRSLVTDATAYVESLLAARYERDDPPRLIHGDLQDGNVMLYRGRMTVFDFEDTIVGYPEHDIVVALYGAYFNRDDFDDVVAALRDGYERVGVWPLGEVVELAPLFAARCLLLMDYCVLMGPELHEWLQLLAARVESILREPTHRPLIRAGG